MVRKNYSEEQEKMARFAKANGASGSYSHTSIFGLAGMLLFWRHSRRTAHSQGYSVTALEGTERSRTDSGRD